MTSFLDIQLSAAIHPDFESALSAVDASIHQIFDNLPADEKRVDPSDPASSPMTFRDWCGVNTLVFEGGGLHAQGRAVDIDADVNPYIATRTQTVLGGEAVGANNPLSMPLPSTFRGAAVAACDRAMQWAEFGTQARLEDRPKQKSGTNQITNLESTASVHARFKQASDALPVYLGMVFRRSAVVIARPPAIWPSSVVAAMNAFGVTDSVGVLTPAFADLAKGSLPTIVALLNANPLLSAALSGLKDQVGQFSLSAIQPAALESANPQSERRVTRDEALQLIADLVDDPEWSAAHSQFTDPEAIYQQILLDYELVRTPLIFGTPSVLPPQKTRNPARGFMTLREQIVVAMCDVGLLRWGASDFGAGSDGDMMHFDLPPSLIVTPAP